MVEAPFLHKIRTMNIFVSEKRVPGGFEPYRRAE